ncbi:MAG: hypothetical protein NVS4B11_29950 [Ktedonobacteraceae bacterium]
MFAEIIIDARQIRMFEIRQHVCLLFELVGGFGGLLRTQIALPHLFDGDKATAKLCILHF